MINNLCLCNGNAFHEKKCFMNVFSAVWHSKCFIIDTVNVYGRWFRYFVLMFESVNSWSFNKLKVLLSLNRVWNTFYELCELFYAFRKAAIYMVRTKSWYPQIINRLVCIFHTGWVIGVVHYLITQPLDVIVMFLFSGT